VREAEGGAAGVGEAEAAHPEAVIVDSWLPDLDLSEFLSDFRGRFPGVDVVTAEGSSAEESPRGPYRQELLYALRRSQETIQRCGMRLPQWTRCGRWWNCRNWNCRKRTCLSQFIRRSLPRRICRAPGSADCSEPDTQRAEDRFRSAAGRLLRQPSGFRERLPELVGNAPCMLEVSRRMRLVAPRMTPVLIEGPDRLGQGTGGRGAAPAVVAQPQAVCRHQLRGDS
jgi:hypothetical protein